MSQPTSTTEVGQQGHEQAAHSHQHGGNPHQHPGHGHGHGHEHSHGDDAKADLWDGQKYLARKGVQETAKISHDSIIYALEQAGFTKDDIKNMDLLEVGSGPGAVTSHLAQSFSSIHSIDTSPSMLLALSSNLPSSSPSPSPSPSSLSDHPSNTTETNPTSTSTSTNSNITYSLHSLSPSSPSEFLTPLFSPTPTSPERRLVPPRSTFDLAIANLVLHHVDSHLLPGFFVGLKGLLKEGGYFVITEFGVDPNSGEDIAKKVRDEMADERLQRGEKTNGDHTHGHVHPSYSVESIIESLERYGFVDVRAVVRGTLPVWEDKAQPPCLIAWGRKP